MNKPDHKTLDRFARGAATAEETAEVVRWMLVSGAVNQATAASGLPMPAVHPDGYDDALMGGSDFLAGLRLADPPSRSNREARVVEVAAMPAAALEAQRNELVDDAVLRDWTICHHLLDAVASAVLDDPVRAEALASVTVGIMERLQRLTPDDRVGVDFLVLGIASMANARRVRGDLAGAEHALLDATNRLEGGTGDPLIEARLLGIKVSQRRDQRRLTEARRLARRGARLARRVGDLELESSFKLKISTIYWNENQPEKAMGVLEGMLPNLDAISPRLRALVHQNLISANIAQGRLDEAARFLEMARARMAAAGGPLDQARIVWLGGRIAAHRGEHQRAETEYLAAREVFVAREIGFDIALINLELAEVYLERGELVKVQALATAMMPAFASRDVHREAQLALRIFCKAAQAEEAGTALVSEVRDFLERSRQDPTLRFRDPS